MPQVEASEVAENKQIKSRNLKRVSELDPELREKIPAFFDRMEAERAAKQFGVPKPEIIEEVLRDTRVQLRTLRRQLGIASPALERPYLVARRTA